MTREELLAQARMHMWAAWALSSEELASQAAETLIGLGMLVPEGGAQELVQLRARVAELETAPSYVYRAEHTDSGIVLGTYANRDAACGHCEALARREGETGLVSWVPNDGDALSPEELTFFDVEYCDGDDVPRQTCTGYIVTPLEIASTYDEEAAE